MDQKIKLAILALRLGAPHSDTFVDHMFCGYSYDIEEGEKVEEDKVEIVNKEYEEGMDEDQFYEENKFIVEEQVGEVWTDFTESVYRSAITGKTWKPYPRYQAQCFDCGKEICQGRFRATEPELMCLGSGTLKAYSVDGY